jgi:hypothetical protein
LTSWKCHSRASVRDGYERQLHLIGAFVRNPALHASRLQSRQHKLIANAPPALSLLEPGRTVAPECATPTADRPAMHPDSQRRFHMRRSLLDKKNRTMAQSFLRLLIQFTRVA